jgi:aspartate/tyrosine/aromatic aminotransferase
MQLHDQLAEVRTLLKRAHTAANTETALDLAVGAYKQAAGYITIFQELQAEAKALISEVFTETGQTAAVTSAGKVTLSAPTVLVSYDAKAVDILCKADPELALKLFTHRRETMRAGGLVIR